MSLVGWALVWLAGALITALGLGTLRRQETLAHALFWPVYLSATALVAVLVLANRLGRHLRNGGV